MYETGGFLDAIV